jgi:streptogramin lyase
LCKRSNKSIGSIVEMAPNNGTTFLINVNTSGSGTVIANIPKAEYNYTGNILGTTGIKPNGIKIDSLGNIYTTNYDSNTVTKISPQGVSTVFANTDLGPNDLTIDNLNNIYTINSQNNYGGTIYNNSNSITKITPQGVTSTFNNIGLKPFKIVSDQAGNMYVADNQAGGVLKVTPQGVVTTFYSGSGITDIAIDSNQNVYIATNYYYYNWKYEVIKVTPQGVSSLYGSVYTNIAQIVVDSVGNVFATVYDNQKVYKFSPQGTTSLFYSMAIDSSDNIYTGSYPNNNITKITPQGVALNIQNPGSHPKSITVDNQGNIYSANYLSNNVTKFTKSLLSGVGTSSNKGNQASSSVDNSTTISAPIVPPSVLPLSVTINQSSNQIDPATNSPIKFTAVFSEPIDVTSFDISDVVLTGSAPNKVVNSITQIAPNNGTSFEIVVAATGSGTIIADIPAGSYNYVRSVLATTNSSTFGIVNDQYGNIYTTNYSENYVTKITPDGASTIFGTTGNGARGLTIDQAGNLYVANLYDNTVTKITPSGSSSILGTTGGSPFDITIDKSGNVYTGNTADNNVTKITPSGLSSILGTTGAGSRGIQVDGNNNIYVASASDNNVTKITPSGLSSILGTTGIFPNKLKLDSLGNVYTININSNNITKITPGGQSSVFSTGFNTPNDLVIDIDNNIFVTNVYSRNVIKITPDGASTVFANTSGYPLFMKIDDGGNLFATNQSPNVIDKFTKTIASGIETTTHKSNQVSTSGDNSITLNNAYTLGSYSGPLTGSANDYFPNIYLNGSNIPDGTPASLALPGTTNMMMGTIQYGYFQVNNYQTIPSDVTIGPAIAILSTSITPSINIPTDFTTPSITGNFIVTNPSTISYDDNNDAIVTFPVIFNRNILVSSFTADDISFGFYQGCNVVLISPNYSTYSTYRFDVVMNCGRDPAANNQVVYPQIQAGKVTDGQITNSYIADRGATALLKYMQSTPVTIGIPAVINSSNYNNIFITGNCIVGYDVTVYMFLMGENFTTTCQPDGSYSVIPTAIQSGGNICGVAYYASCDYLASVFQTIPDPQGLPNQYGEIENIIIGSTDYGIFDTQIYGTISVDNTGFANGINYITAQPNYFQYYCGDSQVLNVSINNGQTIIGNCDRETSIDFLNYLPYPLSNGPINIAGTTSDQNGNSQPINNTFEVCLDPNYYYYPPQTFLDFGTIKASAQNAPTCTPDSCSTSSSSSSQVQQPGGFLDIGLIKANAQTQNCSSSSSAIFSIQNSSISAVSSSTVDQSSITTSSQQSSISSQIISASQSSSLSDTSSSVLALSSAQTVSSTASVISSSVSSDSCVIIIPLVPICNNSNSSSQIYSSSSETNLSSSFESSSSTSLISSTVEQSSLSLSSSSSLSEFSSSSEVALSSISSLDSSASSSISSDSCIIIIPLVPICPSLSSSSSSLSSTLATNDSSSSSSQLLSSNSSSVIQSQSSAAGSPQSSNVSTNSSQVSSSSQTSSPIGSSLISSSIINSPSSSSSTSQSSSDSCTIVVPLVSNCSTSSSSSSSVSSLISSSLSSSVSSPSSISSSSFFTTSSTTEDQDNIPAAIENLAPNNGDGNQDGVKDGLQSDVTSVLDPISNRIVTIEIKQPGSIVQSSSLSTSSSSFVSSLVSNNSSVSTQSSTASNIDQCKVLNNVSIINETDNQIEDPIYYYPVGLVNFESSCATKLDIKIYWYGLDISKSYVNRKLNSNGQAYSTFSNINTEITTVNGGSVYTYNYTVYDNSDLDEDPRVGYIKDPVGPALLSNNSIQGGGVITIGDKSSNSSLPSSDSNPATAESNPNPIGVIVQGVIDTLAPVEDYQTQSESESINTNTVRTGGSRNHNNLFGILLILCGVGMLISLSKANEEN